MRILMRIHCLTHVPFEDAANIGCWASQNGYPLHTTQLYTNQPMPDLGELDLLVILGGPMSVHDLRVCPWLAEEKLFIRRTIDAGKKVLGICLGGQLIADVLGGEVARNPYPEIGWHPIRLSPEASRLGLFEGFAEELTVFHWHGETFSVPRGAVHLASSPACRNQAFLYGSHVLGLQFHLEYSRDSILAMLKNCGNEIVSSRYIQTAEEIQRQFHRVETLREPLFTLLDRFVTANE
jgi:GMP synthase-like glutamine amidotransferase